MKPLHKRGDLSRWNRAGLSRFRYVDGNAITHLESLRLAMVEELVKGKADARPQARWTALETRLPVADNESPAERQQRWRAQYFDERRDYAWEILRSFARASHVLTEHLDTYVNEGFIGTATQWDNVRRLVEMLDYHPAPPASAQTELALMVKGGQSGLVAAGLAVKNTPTDGSPAAIFETLQGVEVDAQLNALRPAQWNRSQLPFYYSPHYTVFPLAEPLAEVAPGTLGVLLIEQNGAVLCAMQVEIAQVFDQRLILRGEAAAPGYPAAVSRHQVRLLLKPEFKKAPRLMGANVVQVQPGHGLSEDDVLAWYDGGWRAARVEEQRGNSLRLSTLAPPQGCDLYLTICAERQNIGGYNRVVLPAKAANLRVEGALWSAALVPVESSVGQKKDAESNVVLYDYLSGYSYPKAYYLLDGDANTRVLTSQPQSLVVDGDPGGFGAGDWLVVSGRGGLQAAAIAGLKEAEKRFELQLTETVDAVEAVFGDFALDIRPAEYDRNVLPVYETRAALRSSSASWLPLDVIPAPLKIGRALIIAGPEAALAVTVMDIDRNSGLIKVSPAIPGSAPRDGAAGDAHGEAAGGEAPHFPRWATHIYANVVTVGHGERQPVKILGSGDASQKSPSFVLAVEDISFVRDSLFPSGVRAALEVTVDRRRWAQVATLNDAEAEDSHYCVRMNEDGTLTIEFGDGRHGRRLPTGNNNVQVSYRVGVGRNANLAAASLTKLVKPHNLLSSVYQPLPASGGNTMESVESLRQNAPASVLALSRAVSLADFQALAQTNSSVWQARAAMLAGPAGGSRRQVDVVVVPAGGGALGSLQADLQSTLSRHAVPGVAISVRGYRSLVLDLTVRIRVDSGAYAPELIRQALLNTLREAFALQRSRLGSPLFVSQVLAVIESVEGVENADCSINPGGFRDERGVPAAPKQVIAGRNGGIKRVSPAPDQVLFIHPVLSVLTVEISPFSL